MPTVEAIMSKSIIKSFGNAAMALAILAVALPLAARGQALVSSANVFGQCATHKNPDVKLVACRDAARSTSYPWILRWVYKELARAHRERGETDMAIVSYARSLAAHDDDGVRREMESLLTQ